MCQMSKPSLPGARWNAADYAANSAVQQTWARELIARLKLRGDEHVLDVGCGDGKVTAEIAQSVPRGWRDRGMLRHHRVVRIDASGISLPTEYRLRFDPDVGVRFIRDTEGGVGP